MVSLERFRCITHSFYCTSLSLSRSSTIQAGLLAILKPHAFIKDPLTIQIAYGQSIKLGSLCKNTFVRWLLPVWRFWYCKRILTIIITLPNKLHEPTHCKIGYACVYNGHVFLYYVVIIRQSNSPILQLNSIIIVLNLRVSRQCSYTIYNKWHVNRPGPNFIII